MRIPCYITVILWMAAAEGYAHGDLHQQIDHVSKQIEMRPSATLYLKRGELQREHRDFRQALEDYRRAAELDPAMDAVHFCRGKALAEAGRNEAAREALDAFLSRVPSHGPAHLARARVLTGLRQYLPAAKDYEQMISLTPDPGPEPFLELAQAYQLAGDPDAAIRGLDAGMERLGGAIPTLQSAAIALEVGEKRYDAALARTDGLLRGAARKESWQALRADILVKAGRMDEARAAYMASLASIEALPTRLRNLEATRQLERRVRAGLDAG